MLIKLLALPSLLDFGNTNTKAGRGREREMIQRVSRVVLIL